MIDYNVDYEGISQPYYLYQEDLGSFLKDVDVITDEFKLIRVISVIE